MAWNDKPIWLKWGAVVSILFVFVILPLTYFIELIFGFDRSIIHGAIGVLAPIFVMSFFALIFGISFVGLIYVLFGIFFTLIQFFILGAFLGFIYSRTQYKKALIFIYIIILIIVVSFSIYINIPYKSFQLQSFQSVEECNNNLNYLNIGKFNLKLCLEKVAVAKRDISICDLIKESQEDDIKWSCYLQIAVDKKDSSICDLIKDKTDIEYVGSDNLKLDIKTNCYLFFKMCNKIEDETWRANCLRNRNLY